MNDLFEKVKLFGANHKQTIITTSATVIGVVIGVAIGSIVANAINEEMTMYNNDLVSLHVAPEELERLSVE